MSAIVLLACTACGGDAMRSPRSNAGSGSLPVESGGGGGLGGASGSGGSGGVPDFGNRDSGPPPLFTEPDAAVMPEPMQVPREDCGTLRAIVRDFHSTHPDMERPFNIFSLGQGEKGLVRPALEDGFPVYAHAGASPGGEATGPLEFYQWYVDDPAVNMRFELELSFSEIEPGRFVYDNAAFFPIDGMGFGNEGNANNFHFTTEVRTEVTYMGNETFTFRGDDDLWMFINGQQVIDLGGTHGPLEQTVSLAAEAGRLGLVVGETYAMDIFHAERHTVQSNFRIETNIACFTTVDPPPPPPPPVVD